MYAIQGLIGFQCVCSVFPCNVMCVSVCGVVWCGCGCVYVCVWVGWYMCACVLTAHDIFSRSQCILPVRPSCSFGVLGHHWQSLCSCNAKHSRPLQCGGEGRVMAVVIVVLCIGIVIMTLTIGLIVMMMTVVVMGLVIVAHDMPSHHRLVPLRLGWTLESMSTRCCTCR